MRWPKVIKAQTENNQITAIYDLLPTFCDIAGIEAPKDRVIDGKSIFPYIRGEKVSEPIQTTFIVPNSTIRYKHWKLAFNSLKPGGGRNVPGAKAGSLFNLKNDVGETTDVSKQHPEIVQELTQKMNDYMKELQSNSRKMGTVSETAESMQKPKKKKKKQK